MTIIAYRKGVMASDTKLSAGGLNWSNCTKIKKVKGWLIGAAGPWDASEAFMAHFDPIAHIKTLKITLPPATDKDDAMCAIMVSPKGKIYYTEAGGVIGTLRTQGFIAIGSGEGIAMAGMEMGATAIEAVKLAMKYNVYCGGRVHKIKL